MEFYAVGYIDCGDQLFQTMFKCEMIENLIKFFPISELAGYNAARADFDTEYDNGVELLLNGIEVDERMYKIVENSSCFNEHFKRDANENEENEQLFAELCVRVLDVYKNKLRARNKRKRYINDDSFNFFPAIPFL